MQLGRRVGEERILGRLLPWQQQAVMDLDSTFGLWQPFLDCNLVCLFLSWVLFLSMISSLPTNTPSVSHDAAHYRGLSAHTAAPTALTNQTD